MPTALALSPHLDDAGFSCGGTLAKMAASGWHVAMATVFTGSVANPQGFALACQTDKGLGPEVDYMALRRAEDRLAAKALGIAAPHHLGFREAPHRGYGSAPELFSDLRADDAISGDLSGALRDLFSVVRPDLVLAPQGVGGHVDHIQVILALRALAPSQPILWWRDFPYTVRSADPKEPLRGTFSALPPFTVSLGSVAASAKRDACAAYASQLGFQFGGLDGLTERLAQEGSVETFRLSGQLPERFPSADALA